MALSQDDRISISKKIIEIPKQNAQADVIKGQLEEQRKQAKEEDNGNKQLMDDLTSLINLYQQELERYDGNGRNQLSEQDLQDSANKVLQNPFFPNDTQTPLPNVPDGVWKNFQSFSNNKAVGKQYDETFTTVTKEQDLIDNVNAQIAVVEAENDVTRSTGQECISGSCSMPQYDNQTDCEDNGGTWDSGASTIQPNSTIQQAITDLKNAVQAWEDFLNGTFAVVPTTVQDDDSTRDPLNQDSRDDITNAISVIDTWQALDDFDTSHGETTCSGFNSIDVNTLNATKLRAAELNALKNEISARQTFISTRISQLEGDDFLGSVTQDFSSGEIQDTKGLYGDRYRVIETRLNLMGGSLNKLKGFERGQNAQEQLKASNDNAAQAYTTVIAATAFRAPAAGTGTIHVLDASQFSPGDSVFVVANNQQELSGTISSISNNTVFLDFSVPKKYRQNAGARLYKIL